MAAAKTLDRYANQADMVELSGASYRQIDWWTRNGYLHSAQPLGDGSGYCRYWPAGEVVIARRMKALTDIGVRLEVAEQIARNGEMRLADIEIRVGAA